MLKSTRYSILQLFNGFKYDFVHVICLHCTSAGCCDALSVRYFACQIVHFAVYFTSCGLAVTICPTTTINGLLCCNLWTFINISNGIQVAWWKLDVTPSINNFDP